MAYKFSYKKIGNVKAISVLFTGKDHSGIEIRGFIEYKKDKLGYMDIEIKI